MPNQTGRLSEISLLISSICCCWWCSVWFRISDAHAVPMHRQLHCFALWLVTTRWCPTTLVEDKGEEEKENEKLMKQVSRMVAILIICWQLKSSRYNLDKNVLEQREVSSDMDEGADEELLKQVGNVMHTVLVEFQGCAGRSIFLWGGAGRGKGKNPRGGARVKIRGAGQKSA